MFRSKCCCCHPIIRFLTRTNDESGNLFIDGQGKNARAMLELWEGFYLEKMKKVGGSLKEKVGAPLAPGLMNLFAFVFFSLW